MKKLLLAACLLLIAQSGFCEMRTGLITYGPPDSPMEGYLAYDDAIKGKRPGILVIHEWWGINDYIRGRTEAVAKLGYVAFAADIYGKGIRAASPGEAGKLSRKFSDNRALVRERARAGLDVLRKQKQTDPNRLAAMGYCFGGMAALELARSGADLKGTATFHGILATPNPDATKIRGSILVLTGADDPYVKPKQIIDFGAEMETAKVDWQAVVYGNAVHSFTNPASGNDPSKGIAHDILANKRSWKELQVFLKEVFGK